MAVNGDRRRGSVVGKVVTWGVVLAVMGVGGWRVVKFWGELRADAERASRGQQGVEADGAGEAELPVGVATMPAEGADGVAGVRAAEVAALMSPEERRAKVEGLLERGGKRAEEMDLVGARGDLNAALGLLGEAPGAGAVRGKLAAMNEGVFFGPDFLPEDPDARLVEVAAGDTIPKLARKYRIPQSLLLAMNPELDPKKMRPGRGIKIVQGPFNMRYVKQARRLDVLARDMYVCSLAGEVEVGSVLPVGKYRVKSGGKLGQGDKRWIGIEGVEADTREVKGGWLYGSAGARAGVGDREGAGILMRDVELGKLYNVVVEGESVLAVEP